MSIRIHLEIGHEASIRTKKTHEGFTHDWEVFVRGCDGAEIQYYVDKVVFYLHETFPKPKRVVKEPPYAVKESGYAGFNLPIDIYLRNNGEPKKIRFNYDLHLQQHGPAIYKVEKEKYVFNNPTEEFKHKLLKGGGLIGPVTQEVNESRLTLVDDKNQMTSKPKLSGSDMLKKHKMKSEEPRTSNSFHELFGPPITKTSKSLMEPKAPSKDVKSGSKLDKASDKNSGSKPSPHKEKSKDFDKKDKDEKKMKDKYKERERSSSSKLDKMAIKKDKSPHSKSSSPQRRSPKRQQSPSSQPPPLPSQSLNDVIIKQSSSVIDATKEQRLSKSDSKKSKKDKRDSNHKENNKQRSSKDSDDVLKSNRKEAKAKIDSKMLREMVKEKDVVSPVTPPQTQIPQQQQQQMTKVSGEKKEKIKDKSKDLITKDDSTSTSGKSSEKLPFDKSEEKLKKYKKKDKDHRKDKNGEKSHKIDKKLNKNSSKKDIIMDNNDGFHHNKDDFHNNHPSSTTTDLHLTTTPANNNANIIDDNKFVDHNIAVNNKPFVDDDNSSSSTNSTNVDVSSTSSSLQKSNDKPNDLKLLDIRKSEQQGDVKRREKIRNKEKKSYRDVEKKTKRKQDTSCTPVVREEPSEKVRREETNANAYNPSNSDVEQHHASTTREKQEMDDYISVLRDLQHKIKELKDNADLQKVVQLIAETGRYEVSEHTFDFDLCLLDRSTVEELQKFFASET